MVRVGVSEDALPGDGYGDLGRRRWRSIDAPRFPTWKGIAPEPHVRSKDEVSGVSGHQDAAFQDLCSRGFDYVLCLSDTLPTLFQMAFICDSR